VTPASKPVPVFAENSGLCRYIDPGEYRGKRVLWGAFMPNPGETYLSINSLEVEEKREICNYYAEAFQKGIGPVAVCMHSVKHYNELAKKASCTVIHSNSQWMFTEPSGVSSPAYRHRPISKRPSYLFESWSHSGVEFIRALSDLQLRHLARRLAKKKAEILQS
jgi:hypothetical protein